MLEAKQVQVVPAYVIQTAAAVAAPMWDVRLRVGVGAQQELRIEAGLPLYLLGINTRLSWKAGFKGRVALIRSGGFAAGIFTTGFDPEVGVIASTGPISAFSARRMRAYVGFKTGISKGIRYYNIIWYKNLNPLSVAAFVLQFMVLHDTSIAAEIGYNGHCSDFMDAQLNNRIADIHDYSSYAETAALRRFNDAIKREDYALLCIGGPAGCRSISERGRCCLAVQRWESVSKASSEQRVSHPVRAPPTSRTLCEVHAVRARTSATNAHRQPRRTPL